MKPTSYIPEYEAKTGKKASRVVARFAEQMDIVCTQFEDDGSKDAAQGRPMPSDGVFQSWAKKIFENDDEMAETIADLARLYYMDGYQKGGAADGV